MACRETDWLTECMTDWLSEWLPDERCDWLLHWLTGPSYLPGHFWAVAEVALAFCWQPKLVDNERIDKHLTDTLGTHWRACIYKILCVPHPLRTPLPPLFLLLLLICASPRLVWLLSCNLRLAACFEYKWSVSSSLKIQLTEILLYLLYRVAANRQIL